MRSLRATVNRNTYTVKVLNLSLPLMLIKTIQLILEKIKWESINNSTIYHSYIEFLGNIIMETTKSFPSYI